MASTRTRRARHHRTPQLSPKTAAVLAVAVLFAIHPHLLAMILAGVAIAVGFAAAAAVVYAAGLKAGWFGTPARIVRDKQRGWSVEFL